MIKKKKKKNLFQLALRGYNLCFCLFVFPLLRYLKNPILFSIRIKGLFEPIILQREADGYLLLSKAFSNTIFFNEITPKFTYSQKLHFFFKYNWNVLDELFLTYKFHGSGMRGIYFLTLPVVSL